MKHLIIAIVAVMTCLAAGAQTGVDAMAKQRARDVANQNNNRSMDPNAFTGATPTPTAAAPAAPAPQPMNSAQQAYARFQASLLALHTNSTDATKQQFAVNLAAVAQGANKPSSAATSKLSQQLAEALSESKLTSAKKIHVAQEVAVLMNSANKTPEQAQAGIKEVQSTLESGGASSENASAVAAGLQGVVDEIQKPAAK
jgi:hypothetical protein